MLEDFIQTNEINAQLLTFDEEVATSSQAASLEKTFPVAKTILFAHEKGYVLVIVEGAKRVDSKAVEQLLDSTKIRLANPGEVEEVTGYEVGGVPPISVYGTPTLIDEGVLSHAWVLAGGGTKNTLLKIQSKDILEHAYEPQVVHVAEEKK